MPNNDRVEFKQGDRYYKIIIDGFIVALCPNDITAKMCYFALRTYKDNLRDLAKQLEGLDNAKQ